MAKKKKNKTKNNNQVNQVKEVQQVEEVDVTPKEENIEEDISLQNLIEKDTNSMFVIVLVGVIAALCTFVLLNYVDSKDARTETIIQNFTIEEKAENVTSNSTAVEIIK